MEPEYENCTDNLECNFQTVGYILFQQKIFSEFFFYKFKSRLAYGASLTF